MSQVPACWRVHTEYEHDAVRSCGEGMTRLALCCIASTHSPTCRCACTHELVPSRRACICFAHRRHRQAACLLQGNLLDMPSSRLRSRSSRLRWYLLTGSKHRTCLIHHQEEEEHYRSSNSSRATHRKHCLIHPPRRDTSTGLSCRISRLRCSSKRWWHARQRRSSRRTTLWVHRQRARHNTRP